MGMFDSVRCEHPLPAALAAVEGDWQTKSLACELQNYVISAAGRLLRNDGSDTHHHGVMRLIHLLPGLGLVGLEAKFSDGSLVHLRELPLALYDEHGLRLHPPTEVD